MTDETQNNLSIYLDMLSDNAAMGIQTILREELGYVMDVHITIFPTEDYLEDNPGTDTLPCGLKTTAQPDHTLEMIQRMYPVAVDPAEPAVIWTPDSEIKH